MKKPTKPRDITRRSAHVAQLIVQKNLTLIHKKLKKGEALARHEGQFAIDALKLVSRAIDEGQGSKNPEDWNRDTLREQLRAQLEEKKAEGA